MCVQHARKINNKNKNEGNVLKIESLKRNTLTEQIFIENKSLDIVDLKKISF